MSELKRDLSGTLATLARRLPPAHVAAWARILRETPAAAAADVQARLIEAKSGFAIGGAAALLVEAWRAADPPLSGPAVALALETAALLHAECAAHRSDVVVSGPVSDATHVRLTGSVISEVIHESRESLLVVSFAAFGITEVVHELGRAAQRGVRIDLVLEGTADQGGTLHGTHGASAAFESLQQHATFWTWPARSRPVVGSSRAALHAKVLAADERIAFLGSANLTDKALAYNLEVGVMIRDPAVVRRMVQHFRSLMKPGAGALEIVSGPV